jgi:NADH dehydrogenase [ubiquinone] 1 alpha subcomplex assembly factor 7
MRLEEIIKDRIRENGALTIAQFMEIALAHPEYGYYMKRDPFGAGGDFITAPEISQVFGEIIGAWLAHCWQQLGSLQEVALVELGSGRGTLMADILRATKNIKGFHEAISIHLVEISPVLKQKQWKTLAGKHERIEWHETISTLPELPLLLVANEFFDALPIRQFVKTEAGSHERMVDIVDGELTFVPQSANNIIETCEPALGIIKTISQHIGNYSGAALIIDYGYLGGSKGDTLQALKNHKFHDILKDIGDCDITAHVDFQALEGAASGGNMLVHKTIPQGAFLMRLGAGVRTTSLCEVSSEAQQKNLLSGLKRLADPQEMGELFKVMAITSKQIPNPEGF